jgi:hypothetical protein
MKTRTLIFFCSALIALSAFFFVSFLSFAEENRSTQSILQPVTISKVWGKVEVYFKVTSRWQDGEIEMQLKEGDKIRTAERAKAELILKDGSFIRMKEKTTLVVKVAREKVSPKSSEYNLDFHIGEIMVKLKKLKKGSSFKVETPTAVAAIRGTTFYMRTGTKEVNGQSQPFTDLYVDSDDIVSFFNTISGQNYDVQQYEDSSAYGDGSIEEPEVITPQAQDAWRGDWNMPDNSGKSDNGEDKVKQKGMRDIDEEEGEEEETTDVNQDIADTVDTQNGTQDNTLQDQNEEQDITGLDKADIVYDSDRDGVADTQDHFPTDPNRASGNDLDGDGIDDEFDSNDNDGPLGDLDGDGYNNAEDEFPRDYWEYVDTDNDAIGDFEDAFPEDNTIDPDITFNDIYGNPVTVKGYGSQDQLRQEILNNLLAIKDLRKDISDMIEDIHVRQFEALKEQIFDHQTAKVMRDRWGNRVRVEEYISKPTDKQVQILALNLRTAGPNAGISSFDFRVKFYDSITWSLRDLPWDDYMHNPLVGDFEWVSDKPGENEGQLILYQKENPGYYNPQEQSYNYPIPKEFSLEIKNPYGESIKATENYSKVYSQTIEFNDKDYDVWYQVQKGERMYINNERQLHADYYEDWGRDWNQENRFTFLNYYGKGENRSWLMGIFYLIDDNGNLIDNVDQDYINNDRVLEILGLRDLVNPDYNLEMVFLSSEFKDTPWELPQTIAEEMEGRGTEQLWEDYLFELYTHTRSIDVITIPEITEPYYRKENNPDEN